MNQKTNRNEMLPHPSTRDFLYCNRPTLDYAGECGVKQSSDSLDAALIESANNECDRELFAQTRSAPMMFR